MSRQPVLERLRRTDDKIYDRFFRPRPWTLVIGITGAAAWVVIGVVQAIRGEPRWLVYAALAVIYVALYVRSAG